MENGEWRITVRVFRSPFLFIGCYFMAYIYIICTICAVGCAKVKSAINYNSQVLGVITRERVARPCLSRLRRVNRMCSRTVSDTANRLRKTRRKKSSAVLLISERSHVGNLRQIRKQGKGRSSKRKGNRRCPFLFAPAAGAATFPPSADGESPPLNLSEKHPAR